MRTSLLFSTSVMATIDDSSSHLDKVEAIIFCNVFWMALSFCAFYSKISLTRKEISKLKNKQTFKD